MILPSINAFNCGKPLRAMNTLLDSNVSAHRKNVMDWAIRSQATRKRAEGSTTTRSSLNLIGMANLARTGRFIAFAFLFIFASTNFANVVHAGVFSDAHKLEVLNPVIVLDAVDMVDDFTEFQNPSNGFLHNEPVFLDIPLAVGERMVLGIDEPVAVMVDKPFMIGVGRGNTELDGYLVDSFPCDFESFGYLLSGLAFTDKCFNRSRVYGLSARDAETLHVSENEFFADSEFISDSLKGAELLVGISEFPFCRGEFTIGHIETSELVNVYGKTISPNLEIRKSNLQEIVWTASKDAEGRIKSLPITLQEIKKYGDTVHIRVVPDVTIRDYTIGQKLVRERPTPSKVSLHINKGKYYSLSINSVEKHQADIAYVEKWTDDAGMQMAISIDSGILSDVYADASASNAGNTAGYRTSSLVLGATGAPLLLDKTNILDFLVDCGTCLDEYDVPATQRWIVLPPIFCGMIKKSDLKDASMTGDSTSIMRNGRLGVIDRFTLYVSNQIATTADATGATAHNVIFGHPAAITFAAQLTEQRTIPNPDDFGDLMEGLQVYGYETIKSQALGHAYIAKG